MAPLRIAAPAGCSVDAFPDAWHSVGMCVEDVEFSSAGSSLHGTFSVPDPAVRFPGLVLIGGSGPSDRHNGGLFDALREHFNRVGVADLAYDKRGVGASTGHWETATVDDLAADAAAAVEILRGHARVAAGRIGVLGHSEGGWVALRLAAQHGTGIHLVLNSCPAVTFLESEVFALMSGGLSSAEAAAAGSLLQRLTGSAEAGNGLAAGRQIIASVAHEPWYPKLQAAGFVLDETALAQLRGWGSYDPMNDLSRITAPTLAILGSADPLIPAAQSVERYDASALLTGRRHRSVVFPDAGHRLQTPATGGFAPGYLNRLSDWTHEHAIM